MPPKIKVTRSEIIETALKMVRKHGISALNARGIAAELGCSTQPIFSNFATMEELQSEVSAAAHSAYLRFLQKQIETGEYPPYKSMGMAYISFAKEEKELFKLLFMCDKQGELPPPTEDFKASVKLIMKNNGIPQSRAELMHLEMWSCVHGIAVMLATSFLSFDTELISGMLTDLYKGLQLRHTSEEKEK